MDERTRLTQEEAHNVAAQRTNAAGVNENKSTQQQRRDAAANKDKSCRVYESKAAGMIITVTEKDERGSLPRPPLRFQAPHKWAFGVLWLNETTLAASGIDEARAIKLIESTPDFKMGEPGRRGIWLQSDRGEKQLEAGQSAIRSALKLYSTDKLKIELGRMKAPVPQQQADEKDEAYKERLENLLFSIFSGQEVEAGQHSRITRGAATRTGAASA